MSASTEEWLRKIFLKHIEKPFVPNNEQDAGGFPSTPKHCRSEGNRQLAIAIASASHFTEVRDCLSGKAADESLDLILEAIKLNIENIKVWDFRRTMLEESGSDLNKEWRFMRRLVEANSNLNNYNMWNHILWVVKKLGAEAIVKEFSSTQKTLAKDPENCYAWQNMNELGVMLEPGFIRKEFEFTTKMIDVDVKNRYALFYRGTLVQELTHDDRKQEYSSLTPVLVDDAENIYAWLYRKRLLMMLIDDERSHPDFKNGLTDEQFSTLCKRQFDIRIRELGLVQVILKVHMKNSVAWSYWRWVIGDEPEIVEELKLRKEILPQDPKNYFAWSHMRWIFKALRVNPTVEELHLTKQDIINDAKNEYAWYYRQWLLQELGDWKAGLDFCDQILTSDISNQFAWNQRYFVLKSCGREMRDAIREGEVIYAVRAIIEKPENEFPWRYLKELYRHHDFDDGCLEAVFQFVLSPGIVVMAEYPETGIIMNRKICVNALDTILVLICLHYKPNPSIGALIADLCSRLKVANVPNNISLGADKSVSGFLNGICSILQHVDCMNRPYWDRRVKCVLKEVDMVYDLSEKFVDS